MLHNIWHRLTRMELTTAKLTLERLIKEVPTGRYANRALIVVGSTFALASVAKLSVAAELSDMADYFKQADVIAGPELVECTLSGGSKTTCFQITVKPTPANHTPGPWCPENITDTAETGGIWLENGEVFDVSGAFIENMASFYSDSNWQLFDRDSGAVFVTNTYEKCAGAAKPNVEPEYRQHCVECQMAFLDDDATVTYTVPLEPIKATQTSNTRNGSGLAFNGIRLDGPAPVADILGNYTLAPFDDCGGHINLAVGYHYHAATDCLEETALVTEHGSMVGIAMDGYPILARLLGDGSQASDLDQCGGHRTEQLDYHYHAGNPGSNAILACLTGEYGCVDQVQGESCNASVSSRRRGNGPPDFVAAAQKLGISEAELKQALGAPPPDFEAAASKLGVTTTQLREAMGHP